MNQEHKEFELQGSELALINLETRDRIVVNQGGTSSGMTWSVLQTIILKALLEKLHISVCSVSLPHLKKGALLDFTNLLTTYGLFDEKFYNKTDNIIRIGKS